MKHFCPECGRKDDVIGDDKPLCLVCKTPLVKATESYKGLWMSPRFAIHRMARIVEKHGLQSAECSGRFKQEREAWTSAVWALGQVELTGKEYWVEIETVEQTPDTKVHYLDQSAGHNHVMTHNIEVVDWEQHVSDPIQVIKAKCVKAYPSYFSLVLLVRNHAIINPEMLAQELRGLRIPFLDIWILGRSPDSVINIARIHPSLLTISFDIFRSLKANNQGDFLIAQRRGMSTAFEDLGLAYLPIP